MNFQMIAPLEDRFLSERALSTGKTVLCLDYRLLFHFVFPHGIVSVGKGFNLKDLGPPVLVL